MFHKKQRSGILRGLAVAGVIVATMIGSVPLATAQTTTAEEERPSIAFLVPMYQEHQYGLNYIDNLKEAAEEKNVDLLLLNSRYDAAVQSSQMKIAIARGVDGIVLWPGLSGAEHPMLVQAQRAGIPVGISNSKPPEELDESLYTSFTGPNDQRIGELQADELARVMGGEGNYVYIGGPPGNAAGVNRELGFKRGIENYPGLNLLGSQPGNFDQNLSQTAASALISRFGDEIDAIVTPDDIAAAGASQALRAAGMTDVVLLGHNFAPVGKTMIENGQMTSTLFQSPCWDARQALQSILDVIDGKEVEKERYMPLPVVNEENIDEFTPYGCLPEDYTEEAE